MGFRRTLQVIALTGILAFILSIAAGVLLPSRASALTVAEIQTQVQALISRLSALSAPAVAQPSSTVVASPVMQHRVCSALYRNLSIGMRGDDVLALQEFLQAQGYFYTTPTGYYGRLTAQAVARWQSANGISAVGAVGPLTRARITAWCGGGGGVVIGSLNASPTSGSVPLAVNFTYTPSSGESAQYYIEFDDGQAQVMSVQQIYCIRAPCISPSIASHTYVAAGVYTASVSRYVPCLYTNPRCLMAQPPPLASVQIFVSGGTSGAPVISSFSGPTTLSVDQTGTWSIQASDPENGPLSYSVTWGDEFFAAPMASFAAREAFVQTTTFTHAYSSAGTYTVSIMVRDSAGQEARTTATVRVEGAQYCTLEYAPVCGQKAACPACYYSQPACLAPCSIEYKTYSNRCFMAADGATFVRQGRCEEPVACTADAMQCSDGTWVGRTGPNCQFVCPVSTI